MDAVNAMMDQSLSSWKNTLLDYVRSGEPDLTNRQMALLMLVYLEQGPHTVRGLAKALNVSKPAITRALDRLGELDLAKRKTDPQDRRSVLVQRTTKGSAFLRDIRGVMVVRCGRSGQCWTSSGFCLFRHRPRFTFS